MTPSPDHNPLQQGVCALRAVKAKLAALDEAEDALRRLQADLDSALAVAV